MMQFKEPDVFEIEVLDDDSTVGKLKKYSEGWIFVTEGQFDSFRSSDLRNIADKLDELNTNG